MPLRLTRWITATILLCLGAAVALAFPPVYDFSRLPVDETSQYQLLDPGQSNPAGTLYESLHLEDRYGLSVYVLTRRFEGDLFELETIEFEAESFIPIRATRVQKVRGMNVETDIQFQSTRAVITTREPELLGGKTSTTMLDIPREAITLQQVPYALRTKPLNLGEKYEFDVLPLFGQEQESKRVQVIVEQGYEEDGTTVVQINMGNAAWLVWLTKEGVVKSEQPFTATIGLNQLVLERD